MKHSPEDNKNQPKRLKKLGTRIGIVTMGIAGLVGGHVSNAEASTPPESTNPESTYIAVDPYTTPPESTIFAVDPFTTPPESTYITVDPLKNPNIGEQPKELPATGSNKTGAELALGAGAIAAGTAAIRISRRPGQS